MAIINGDDDSNRLFGTDLTDTINGFIGDDFLFGFGGNDILAGGMGVDVLVGGVGNDVYISHFDFVVEGPNEGIDTIQSASSVNLNLSLHVENLTLTGVNVVTGDGNGLNNVIIGNDGANGLSGHAGNDTLAGQDGNDFLYGGTGNDFLTGGLGVDTMQGNAGNDTYVVDTAGDVVTELPGAGIDTIQSSVSLDLSTPGKLNVEILILTGVSAATGAGNDLNNVITGNNASNLLNGFAGNDTLSGLGGNDNLLGGTGNDFLNGGLGIDTMQGNAGNDTYVVDNAADVVNDFGGGIDTVQNSISFSLSAAFGRLQVENLTLTGIGISGTGNALDNVITGNNVANVLNGLAGNDFLNGGLGVDTMQGNAGNDTYVVDTAGDVVTELPGAGTDTIQSSVSLNLSTPSKVNVENLTLTGALAFSGSGNALNNVITGNNASNLLNGFAGNDTLAGLGGNDNLLGGTGNDFLHGGLGVDNMQGGAGDDTCVVDNAGDVVTELPGAGVDTVQSSISHTLSANVERLTLTGVANIDGTGNNLGNTITGNAGGNLLNGRLGNDGITTGAGADQVRFDTALGAGNIDTITDFNPARDTMLLDDAVFTGLPLGFLAAAAFKSGGPVDANDRIIYNPVTGALSFDPDGSGATLQTQFATLGNLAVISNADFLVV